MQKAVRVMTGVALAGAMTLSGCTSSTHNAASSSVATSTSTTVPEALWSGEARAWLAAHGSDLKAISTWAKNLGDAAKAGNGRLTQLAATQFLIAVGRADDDLPNNAFGQDLHAVFVDYAAALALIRKGLINNDQKRYRAGTDALAAAVQKFAAITNRLKESP
jgi:hypothetical protein